MIEFTKLIFRGFMSYKDRQEVPLSSQGMIHVEGVNKDEGGSNRSGKSAIIEPLAWCLFNQTIRKVKNDSVVHRFAKKRGCYAEVHFRSADIPYRICRYQNHPKHGNGLRLWIAGKEKGTFRHKDDTQRRIESILGCDFNSFSNSVIFGGARPFAALSDAEQKKVLESFLKFEQFDLALRYTKEQASRVEETLTTKRERVAELLGTVKSYSSSLKSLRDSAEEWVSSRSEARRDVFRQLKRLDAIKLAKVSQNVCKRLAHKLEKVQEAAQKQNAKYLFCENQVLEAKKVLENRKCLLGEQACPTCGQDVKKHSLESVLKHYSDELLLLQKRSKKHTKKLLLLQKEEAEARSRLERAQDKQTEYTSKLEKVERLRAGLLEQLKQLQGEHPLVADIEKLAIKYSRAMSKLAATQATEQQLQSHLKDLQFWITGFGNQGVKALIVRQALPAMNAKLKEFSQEIFNGAAQLRFSPNKTTKRGEDRELFNLSYESKFGSDTYLGESAGGRKRVDICILLVFSWLSKICNLLLVDELLDGLDDAGKESVLRILSELRGTVLCISHSKSLKAKAGTAWTVTKKDGCSTLETHHA